MDLFRSLSLAELEAGIRNLSFQIMSGATSISSPDAGSAGYISRGEAMKLLRLLERSRSRRLGLPVDPSDRIRQVQVLPAHEFTEY